VCIREALENVSQRSTGNRYIVCIREALENVSQRSTGNRYIVCIREALENVSQRSTGNRYIVCIREALENVSQRRTGKRYTVCLRSYNSHNTACKADSGPSIFMCSFPPLSQEGAAGIRMTEPPLARRISAPSIREAGKWMASAAVLPAAITHGISCGDGACLLWPGRCRAVACRCRCRRLLQ